MPHPQNPKMKSNFAKLMEQNLNSPYTILSPTGKQAMQEAPTKYIAEAGKKKKNEDKERSKARVQAIQN